MTEALLIMIVAICAVGGCAVSLVNLGLLLVIKWKLSQRDRAHNEVYGKLRVRVARLETYLVAEKRKANALLTASDARPPARI